MRGKERGGRCDRESAGRTGGEEWKARGEEGRKGEGKGEGRR